MAINFLAESMQGYNNPKMCIFPVTVKLEGGAVVDGNLNYSTLTNIIKSGYIPFLYVTLITGDKMILPLVGIDKEGLFYQFCAAMFTSDSKVLISITYGSKLAQPVFKSENIS